MNSDPVRYNRIFNIDFDKLTLLLTPIFWRKITFVSYVRALVDPVHILYNDFLVFRRKSIYKIVHNGQVGLLEKVLNDAFDPADPSLDAADTRRIYITDSLIKDPTYIYTTAEARPVYIFPAAADRPVYLYPFSVFDDTGFDFYVIFPLALRPMNPFDIMNLENRIKALVNYYKLASKRYKILWI